MHYGRSACAPCWDERAEGASAPDGATSVANRLVRSGHANGAQPGLHGQRHMVNCASNSLTLRQAG
eukprot:2242182-Alexandrium_andersonii.AAC.1